MHHLINIKKGYIFFILILVAGALFKSLNAPMSAVLLKDSSPFMTVVFMSAGAAIFGLLMVFCTRKSLKTEPERRLQKKDTPSVLLIILVDLLGNTMFIFGLTMCLASSASLVKCFSLVATAIVAYILLKERISKRLFVAIMLITLGCITIAAGNLQALVSSPGLLLVFGSCVCSGFSYTFKKKLADRNTGIMLLIPHVPTVIIILIIALMMGETIPDVSTIIGALTLGAAVHGLTGVCYQLAARKLGAAKCTTVFGLAPFIGAGISFIVFQQMPTLAFFISFILLIPGFYLVLVDKEDARKIGDDVPISRPGINESHDIRNYLTSVGFLLIFVIGCIQISTAISQRTLFDNVEGTILPSASLVLVLAQILIGCALIILRKRDLAGMFMLIAGFSSLLLVCSAQSRVMQVYISAFFILFGIILLLSKEHKKYYYSVLFLALGLVFLAALTLNNFILTLILGILICLYILLLDIGSSGLLPQLRLTKTLIEDEDIDFSKVGSTLCYLIIAISVLPWIGTYTIGLQTTGFEVVGNFTIACGLFIGLIALLMIFVGKNNFLGIVFLCTALFMMLFGSTTGILSTICGIIMFFTGLLCFLRKKTYFLLGLLCIVYGISSMISVAVYGEPVLVISQFLMHLLTIGIAVYLAISVFCQSKRLPIF